MDTQNEFAVEEGNDVVEKHVNEVEEAAPDIIRESSNGDVREKVTESNEIPEDELKANLANEDACETRASEVTKVLKTSQKSVAAMDYNDDSKAKKTVKSHSVAKRGTSPSTQSQKSSLTQSLSFPSKGPRGRLPKKNVDASPLKPEGKGRKSSDASALNASPAKASDLSETKQVHSDGNSSSKSEKSGFKIIADNLSSDVSLRSSSYGFSFRLNERAEKRKEFNMKIEEKITAKEAEKCDLQAKSKESQEAEIRQLRKNLKFKATPMPTFYKEPPPRVELKKIPTTRPKSPKLGRNKSSPGMNSATEVEDSLANSRRVSDLLSKGNLAYLDKSIDQNPKKLTRKSQERVHIRESGAISKAESKPLSKSTVKNKGENQNHQASIEKSREGDSKSTQLSDFMANQNEDYDEKLPHLDDEMIIDTAVQSEDPPNQIMVAV